MRKLSALYRIILPAFLLTIFFIVGCDEEATAPEDLTIFEANLSDDMGNPIGNALAEALSADEQVIASDISDEFGDFTLENIPEDRESVSLQITHPDFDIFQQKLADAAKNKKGSKADVVLSNPDSCCGILDVLVRDKETEEPINDVEVRVYQGDTKKRRGYTESDGKITFENLCDGEYWVRLYREGYKVIEENFIVENCDTVNFSVFMESITSEEDSCCDGVIYIVTRELPTEEKVDGINIRLWQDGSVIKEAKTEDGTVMFTDLCEGVYVIDILHEKYKGLEWEVELDCDDTLEFVKFLEWNDEQDSCCNGVVYLLVKDSQTSERLKNVKARLYDSEGKLAEKYTNGDGIVTFTDLCEGEYQISILGEGYQGMEFNFTVECDDTLEYVKKLESTTPEDSCCDGVIYVATREKDSEEKINGAKVRLWKDGQMIKKLITENGFVKFEGLCEGKYVIDILHEQYKDMEFVVELDCNDTLEIPKFLERINEKDSCCNGVLIIQPREKVSEEKINGAKIILWKDGQKLEIKYSENGYVRFEDLCEGKYGVDIIHEDYKHMEFLVEMDCDDTLEVPKFLERIAEKDSCCDGVVYLVVHDSTSNDRLKNIKARLWNGSTKVSEQYTNGDGVVIFKDLCEGEYQISIIGEGYYGREFNFVVECDDTLEFHKKILAKDNEPCYTAILKLILKDSETGARINDAFVAIKLDGELVESGRSNGDGLWAADGLKAPATYVVVIEADGYERKEFEITFEKCITIQETIKLTKE